MDEQLKKITRLKNVEQCILSALSGNPSNSIIGKPKKTLTAAAAKNINLSTSPVKMVNLTSMVPLHYSPIDARSNMATIIGTHFIGPDLKELFTIKPHLLSAIVPKLKLYRVDMDKANKVTGTVPFFFDTFVNQDDLTRERESSAGVMSVNWDLQGGNPAEVKRYLELDIKFVFSSIETLIGGPFGNDRKDFPRYLDLFRRKQEDNRYYRLRLDVGWSLPQEKNVLFEKEEGVKRALNKATRSLWLHLRDHDLDFKENGAVELSIRYFSSIEHDMQRASVIGELRKISESAKGSVIDQRNKFNELKQRFNHCRKDKKLKLTERKKKSIEKFISKTQNKISLDNIEFLEKFTNILNKNNLMRYVLVDKSLLQYTTGKSWYFFGEKTVDFKKDFDKYDKSITHNGKVGIVDDYKIYKNAIKNLKDGSKKSSKKGQASNQFLKDVAITSKDDSKIHQIRFVYFGDIFDALVETAKSYKDGNSTIKNTLDFIKYTEIVMGNIQVPVYRNKKIQSYKTVPLSSFPVSYNIFTAWFTKNVIRKGRSIYLIKDMIRDLMLSMVNNFTGKDCFVEKKDDTNLLPRNSPRIDFFTLRYNKKEEIDKLNLTDITKAYNEPYDGKKLKNFLLLYTVNDEMQLRKRDRKKDDQRGIFTVRIGSNVGIVKSVKFTKTDSKYLEESLLTVKPTDMSLEAFRRVYNAEIELFGNSSFFPGQHIYIDPSVVGLGRPNNGMSPARLLGLGGYYLIVAVNSEISPGNFSTSLKTRWVGFGDASVKVKKGTDKKNDCGSLVQGLKDLGYKGVQLTVDEHTAKIRLLNDLITGHNASIRAYNSYSVDDRKTYLPNFDKNQSSTLKQIEKIKQILKTRGYRSGED